MSRSWKKAILKDKNIFFQKYGHKVLRKRIKKEIKTALLIGEEIGYSVLKQCINDYSVSDYKLILRYNKMLFGKYFNKLKNRIRK